MMRSEISEAFNDIHKMHKKRIVENTNSDKRIATRKIVAQVEEYLVKKLGRSVDIDFDEEAGLIYINDGDFDSEWSITVTPVYEYTLSQSFVGPVVKEGKAGDREKFIEESAYDILMNYK